MKFTRNSFSINVLQHEITSGYGIPLNQQIIDSVLSLVQKLKLCKGNTTKFTTQSCVEEMWSLLHDENSIETRYRSQKCVVLLSFLSSSTCCKACSRSYKSAKKRHEAQKEKKNAVPQPDELEADNSTSNIALEEDDENSMQTILKELLSKQAVPEHLQTLMENPLRNSNSKDPRQRRWDPKVISVCLGPYIKSPSSYEQLENAHVLLLPTKRLLQYYKNSVKQEVGFSADNLNWMAMESVRQNVSEFGKHEGLVIVEMSIQDDFTIEREGDS